MLAIPQFILSVEDFRLQVRTFIQDHLPDDIRSMVAREIMDLPREAQVRWHRMLKNQGGWCCPSWPKEYGGPGWSDEQQYVFEQEIALNDAPRLMIYGAGMLGPTLFKYGTDEQLGRFLPGILNADTLWCQGFSEPGSGSDLASLQCRAVRDGECYVVNGSKIWTSEAHIADWIFGIFRTSNEGKKQAGITFMMIDLKSPGISVRPLLLFEGTHEVNQVFFEDVRVPVNQRLGEESQGWEIAKHLLGLERFGTAEVARTRAALGRLKKLASAANPCSGKRLIDEPEYADRICRIETALHALELTERRFLFGSQNEDQGAESSMLKIRGTELQCDTFRLAAQAAGTLSLIDMPRSASIDHPADHPFAASDAARNYFNYRKTPIYSGSNEVMRNIIAKSVLGL